MSQSANSFCFPYSTTRQAKRPSCSYVVLILRPILRFGKCIRKQRHLSEWLSGWTFQWISATGITAWTITNVTSSPMSSLSSLCHHKTLRNSIHGMFPAALSFTHRFHRYHEALYSSYRSSWRCKRISCLICEEACLVLKIFLENITSPVFLTLCPNVICDSVKYTEHVKRTTVTALNGVCALKRSGCTLYGFRAKLVYSGSLGWKNRDIRKRCSMWFHLVRLLLGDNKCEWRAILLHGRWSRQSPVSSSGTLFWRNHWLQVWHPLNVIRLFLMSLFISSSPSFPKVGKLATFSAPSPTRPYTPPDGVGISPQHLIISWHVPQQPCSVMRGCF